MPKFEVEIRVDLTVLRIIEAEDQDKAEELAQEQVELDVDTLAGTVEIIDAFAVGGTHEVKE